MPASRIALRAAWACRPSWVISGMRPTVSVSAAPMIATCLRRSGAMLCPLRRLELRQADRLVHVLKDDFDRQAGRQVLRLRLDADDVRHEMRTFVERDDRNDIRDVLLEAGRGQLVDHIGMQRALARDGLPFDVVREAARAEDARIEEERPAVVAILQTQLVRLAAVPERLRFGGGLRQRLR